MPHRLLIGNDTALRELLRQPDGRIVDRRLMLLFAHPLLDVVDDGSVILETRGRSTNSIVIENLADPHLLVEMLQGPRNAPT